MVTSLDEIQSVVYGFGEKISAPKSLLIVRSAPADDGCPYVEIKGDVFSYVSSERGRELYRKSTHSLDELLYWIMSRAARQMAMEYELENRLDGCDARRIYFSRFIYLLGEIRTEWGEAARQEVEGILKNSPYVDS